MRLHRLPGATVAAALLLLAVAAVPASAAPVTKTLKSEPFKVGPYSVEQSVTGNIPTPRVDGFITRMTTDVVDVETGRVVPIKRIMLHHIVFANLGPAGANQPTVPFYGAGEERAEMNLPPGYGYRITKDDRWAIVWMLMNHRELPDQVQVRYRVTYDTDPTLKPVIPVAFDASHGRQGLVYDVAGGGKKGSLDVRTHTRAAPVSGRLVAGLGHVHGGAKDLALSKPTCGDRRVYVSKPTWAKSNHPFYNVRPVLHEPGPLNMSSFATGQGIPVVAGQPLKLTSRYDAERPHTRVMGLMVVYLSPDESVADPCGPQPGDMQTLRGTVPGRAGIPRATIGLYGLGPSGRAVEVQGPPGRFERFFDRALVNVVNFSFRAGNLSVARGAEVTWRFADAARHNVTVASGPRGFSSDWLRSGDEFRYTFDTPGTYKLFCELHPVGMVQRVSVRR